MKKIIVLLSMLLSICLLTGCVKISFDTDFDKNDAISNFEEEMENESNDVFDKREDESDTILDNLEEEDNDDEIEEEKNDISNAKSFADLAKQGDFDNPLSLNDAGIITIYNYTNASKEADIYLRIKETFSGQKAKKLADEYNENAFITHEITEESEWWCAKVEVDFKDYPTPSYGSGAKTILPSFSVTETDGKTLTFNGYSFLMMPELEFGPVDKSIEEIHQGDVVEFYIIYALPKGYNKDYVIAFEHTDYKTNTCFLIEA